MAAYGGWPRLLPRCSCGRHRLCLWRRRALRVNQLPSARCFTVASRLASLRPPARPSVLFRLPFLKVVAAPAASSRSCCRLCHLPALLPPYSLRQARACAFHIASVVASLRDPSLASHVVCCLSLPLSCFLALVETPRVAHALRCVWCLGVLLRGVVFFDLLFVAGTRPRRPRCRPLLCCHRRLSLRWRGRERATSVDACWGLDPAFVCVFPAEFLHRFWCPFFVHRGT